MSSKYCLKGSAFSLHTSCIVFSFGLCEDASSDYDYRRTSRQTELSIVGQQLSNIREF